MQGVVNDLGQVFVTRPTITVPAVIFLIFVAVRVLTSDTLVPKSLPWVGRPSSGPFAETRASFSSFNNVRAWLQEGYATVGEFLTQFRTVTDENCSTHKRASLISSRTSVEDPRSSFPTTRLDGSLTNLIMSPALALHTMICSRVTILSQILM